LKPGAHPAQKKDAHKDLHHKDPHHPAVNHNKDTHDVHHSLKAKKIE